MELNVSNLRVLLDGLGARNRCVFREVLSDSVVILVALVCRFEMPRKGVLSNWSPIAFVGEGIGHRSFCRATVEGEPGMGLIRGQIDVVVVTRGEEYVPEVD